MGLTETRVPLTNPRPICIISLEPDCGDKVTTVLYCMFQMSRTNNFGSGPSDERSFRTVFSSVANEPIAFVSVCGVKQGGKSLFCRLLIRYLSILEQKGVSLFHCHFSSWMFGNFTRAFEVVSVSYIQSKWLNEPEFTSLSYPGLHTEWHINEGHTLKGLPWF